MTIYRTEAGRDAIRAWADEQLTRWQTDHARRTYPSPLGDTHVLSTGQGPPLVLVPGTNFAAATSLGLIDHLAGSHRVHAVDLPGQPGLSHAERPSKRAAYGHWLAETLTAVTDTPPILVGMSLGARIALDAVRHGAQVAGVGLVVPAGLIQLRVGPATLKTTVAWLRRPSPQTSEALLDVMTAPGNRPSEDLTAWMTLVGRHVRTSLAPPPLPAAALQPLATTPVLVVAGRHDAFLPAGRLVRAATRKLPHARTLVVDGTGHLLPDERPDAVATLVREHLTEPTT